MLCFLPSIHDKKDNEGLNSLCYVQSIFIRIQIVFVPFHSQLYNVYGHKLKMQDVSFH